MRSVRVRILATLLVLGVVGVGGWQLLPSEGSGRTIKVGTTDEVTSLDPAGAYDAGSWALFNNVFQSLLAFEPGSASPVPDAAESCGFKGSDLRTYRCVLREGLTFPSGREMTAKDVKYSFDRVKKINSDVGPASLLSTLQSVGASGRTVTFRLSSPDATFPFKVATGAGAIVDSTKYPANSLRTDNGVDGTGPYELTAYTKGKKAVLAPNGDYKGEIDSTGRPVELDYYGDSDKLNSAWKAKRIDVAYRQLPPDVLAGLNPSDPGQRVSEADSSEIRNLYLNTRAGRPLHDPKVRQAMAWLINREQLAASVYEGTVDPLYSLIPTGITGHTTSFFDAYAEPSVKKARALLAEAGVTTPVSFTYGYGLTSGFRRRGGQGAQEAAGGERPVQGDAQGLRVDRLPKALGEREAGRLRGGLGGRLPRPGHLRLPARRHRRHHEHRLQQPRGRPSDSGQSAVRRPCRGRAGLPRPPGGHRPRCPRHPAVAGQGLRSDQRGRRWRPVPLGRHRSLPPLAPQLDLIPRSWI